MKPRKHNCFFTDLFEGYVEVFSVGTFLWWNRDQYW